MSAGASVKQVMICAPSQSTKGIVFVQKLSDGSVAIHKSGDWRPDGADGF
jgi:hypothetical protein